jgi:hypothetical protein
MYAAANPSASKSRSRAQDRHGQVQRRTAAQRRHRDEREPPGDAEQRGVADGVLARPNKHAIEELPVGWPHTFEPIEGKHHQRQRGHHERNHARNVPPRSPRAPAHRHAPTGPPIPH